MATPININTVQQSLDQISGALANVQGQVNLLAGSNNGTANNGVVANNNTLVKTNENSLVSFDASGTTQVNNQNGVQNTTSAQNTNATQNAQQNSEQDTKMQQVLMVLNAIESKQRQISSARQKMCYAKEADEIQSISSEIRNMNSEIDKYFLQIVSIMTMDTASADTLTGGAMGDSTYGNMNASSTGGTLGSSIIASAKKYLGYNEKDGSYKKFTEGRTEAWCADFVTYVVKEAYAANGLSAPSGFGSPAVNTIESWGRSNGRWISKDNLSAVKPGDIMIQAHHTGIVLSVNADGTVSTIEGNTSDTVAYRTQKLSSIEGFVSIA